MTNFKLKEGRFRLGIRKKTLTVIGEALKQVAQRWDVCPVAGSAQG